MSSPRYPTRKNSRVRMKDILLNNSELYERLRNRTAA